MTDQGFAVIDALDGIAAALGATVAAGALAWLLAKPLITSPIIGANTPEQLAELLPATDLSLAAEELAALDAASSGM